MGGGSEIADGDLYEELKSSGGRFSEARTAGEILLPCLKALQYLHLMVSFSMLTRVRWILTVFFPHTSVTQEILFQF